MGKIKLFLKTKKGIACIIAAAVIILAALGYGGYEIWRYQQPKFHDVTIELGERSIKMSQFMTKYARDNKVRFVNIEDIDLNNAGVTELILAHGKKQETVTFTVQDTTAPIVEFVTEQTVSADYVPAPADFIKSVLDYSDTKVTIKSGDVIPADYSDAKVTVVVTDEHGNSTEQECTLSFVWLYDSYVLEYGDELKREDLLINGEKDISKIRQSDINKINASPVGEYEVTSISGGKTLTCKVTVQDTKGPELVLQEVQIYVGKTTKLEAFVVSCEDISGETEISLKSEIDYSIVGQQTVTVEAKDIYGNVTTGETILYISNDHTPPSISGLGTLYVEKHSEPDYKKGVSAYDGKDGTVSFTYDASSVDTSKAGTYFVTYTAKDASGNINRVKRRVEVAHDQEDTNALVTQIAAGLSSDAEAIRDYVRNSIAYSTSWGGDDPVWYGFNNRSGNCYVHALCLKELLEEKGYSCQLIWVTNKSHYWLIINLGGTWWHIDATPGSLHSRYSLMNDEQRLATLSGRTWDTSMWPACG